MRSAVFSLRNKILIGIGFLAFLLTGCPSLNNMGPSGSTTGSNMAGSPTPFPTVCVRYLTPSVAVTCTFTFSLSPTLTGSYTATKTWTNTKTLTPVTNTLTPTPTFTASKTFALGSSTWTSTKTRTFTNTITSTFSLTGTFTDTPTLTFTPVSYYPYGLGCSPCY